MQTQYDSYLVISSLYGLTDEIHQSFVPYRSATVIDLVKDCIGVLVASWVLYGAYQGKTISEGWQTLAEIRKQKK